MKPKRPRPALDGRAPGPGAGPSAWAALALAAILSIPLAAQAESKIKAIERAMDNQRSRSDALARKADEIARQTAALSRTLVDLAGEARALERRTADLRARLAAIGKLRRAKQKDLAREHARLAKLLAALQRIARNPPEAVLAYSTSAQDTLRSALLLKSILPHMEAQAGALRSQLQALRRLRNDATRRKAALAPAGARLAAKRRKIDRLVAQKKELARATWAEQRRARVAGARLAAKARSLRGLLRRIEKDRKSHQGKPPPSAIPTGRSPSTAGGNLAKTPTKTWRKLALGPIPSIIGARGRLTTPVVGRLVGRFSRKRAMGTRAKGLSFATAPGARVVAPHGGHVVFAGPFRGYGRLLIIEHGEGYHTLLAGLGRIDVAVNQRLLAGEPIGIMAPPRKGNPRLYLELRRNGRPVDPLPWLAATPTDKVSG
ncbi:MAG: murein hydrolase activator EnvC [Alphaproteobacteria bacterium]